MPNNESMRRRSFVIGGLSFLLSSCQRFLSKANTNEKETKADSTRDTGALEDSGALGDSAALGDSGTLGDTGIPVEECLSQPLAVSLSEHPELREIGGSAYVSFNDRFVHILIVCIDEDHWVAVFKVCTHGTCNVEWDESIDAIVCPCHNSIFGINGRVLQGPAVVDLKAYDVCRVEDFLYISPA